MKPAEYKREPEWKVETTLNSKSLFLDISLALVIVSAAWKLVGIGMAEGNKTHHQSYLDWLHRQKNIPKTTLALRFN